MAIENESITGMLVRIIDDLDRIACNNLFLTYEDWEKIFSELEMLLDDEHLLLFIEYLKAEYHAGHRIDPQVDLFERLLFAAGEYWNPDAAKEFQSKLRCIKERFNTWIGWIEEYYPLPTLEHGKQDEHNMTTSGNAKHKTAAAARLASRELQEVKRELVNAGLVENGRWTGSPAEYGELVRHLKEDCGVENRGGYAWKDCRDFVGYEGSDKSAQNAITSNVGNIRSDAAATIRDICVRCKGKLKNREI